MVKSGKISAITLLLATMMLFATTIVPHHHHHGVPCIATTHCQDSCTPETAHNHDTNDGCQGGNCVGEESFFSSDRRDNLEQDSALCFEPIIALLCCEHLQCEHSSHLSQTFFEPYSFKEYSVTLTLSHGLRAPPVA